MTAEAGPDDVITLLIRDHREVEDLFRELDHGAAEPAVRAELVRSATVVLVRHAIAEEMFLYPAVREYVDGGGALADRALAEHAEAERVMKRLEVLAATDPQFEARLAQLTAGVREHVAKEERDLYPALRAQCPRDVLAALGDKVRLTERTALDLPRPDWPDDSPGPAPDPALTPGGGTVDRIRDVLTGRGR